MIVKGNLKGFIFWNGWYYGYKRLKRGNKYYRSKNVIFDDACGGTEECTHKEYFEAAENYARVFKYKDFSWWIGVNL